MKSIQTIRSFVLLAMLVTGLASCQKEEFSATGSETPQGVQLNITVTDGGYTSGDPKTRATENGYVTEFTAGDRIGLYVVKPDGGDYVAENVCLTLTNVNGTLTWQAPAGTNLWYEGATAKYFAYYPYQQSVNGTLQPTATTAADFFADVVTAWSPTTDQSTYAKYTATDLMIGSGILDKQTDGTVALSFTMTHAMALVVIETPVTRYKLSTDANYTWTGEAPGTQFYDFTPYSIDDTYRYLVKPSQSGVAELNGSYTGGNGNTKEYAVSPNSINPANYRHNKVDGGSAQIVTTKTHTLQIGDFYLKDGSLLGKETTLTDAQKAACIGVILKVGYDSSKDNVSQYVTKGGQSMSTIHGYVLALHDASESIQWGSYGEIIGTDRERESHFYGYNNTRIIKEYAVKNSKTLQTDFPATYYATDGYESQYPAPANSSGWFLPSAGQGRHWLNNGIALLTSVRKATDNSGYSWKNWYLSSSESSASPADNVWGISFINFGVVLSEKTNSSDVRSCLAF